MGMWLQEYHSTADRLQLIPASAKRAGGVQFEIALDRAGASAAEMVSVDVKARSAARAKPALSTLDPYTLPQQAPQAAAATSGFRHAFPT